MLNNIVPYFKSTGIIIGGIRPVHIQEYYEHLSAQGMSNNTILHYHAYIRKALQSAFLKELIPCNPADRVERPTKDVYIANTYSAEALNLLLAAVKNTIIELPIMLTVFYGLRRGETLGLRWGNIDFENKTLLINHSVGQSNLNGTYETYTTGRLKKKSSYRTLPLMETVEKRLLTEKERRGIDARLSGNTYICVDEAAMLIKPNFLSKAFRRLLSKNNQKHIRFHDLQHSCANLLISNRVPLIEVQQWLGHGDNSTTFDIISKHH